MNEHAYWLFIIAGFLSGSLLFGVWIPKIFKGKDVYTESEDSNPGAFNSFALCGVPLGMLCLILELAKGFVPVFLAERFLGSEDWRFTLVMIAPVLGHAFSIFHKFQGGKAIAVNFGVYLGVVAVTPVGFILAAIYVLFCTLIPIRPDLKKSIVTFAVFIPVGVTFELLNGRFPIGTAVFFLSAIVLWKHVWSILSHKETLEKTAK